LGHKKLKVISHTYAAVHAMGSIVLNFVTRDDTDSCILDFWHSLIT